MFMIPYKTKAPPLSRRGFEKALMLSGDQWRNSTGPPKQE